MKAIIKRSAVFAAASLMLAMSVLVPINKASAAVTYNNTTTASFCSSVNSSGLLSVNMSVVGMKTKTTRIAVELYVEKNLVLWIWLRVNIGYPNNVWTDSVNNYYYSDLFSTQLQSTGTYRVTVTYTVSGLGGADDIITGTDTVTY
ncbi:MAG: hypothetical protein J5544_01205 [Clostridia bacterium]|nr:hypothetical protein [Clostridia bacterium]